MNISIGKFRSFMRISNDFGQFQMLALDQRNSLKKMIREQKLATETADLVAVKRAILKNLSEGVTAVLVDGEYGFPENLKYLSHHTGIILSAEKSGYVIDKNTKGRLNALYRDDVVEFAKKTGMDAVKLLIYWSDTSSEEIKNHQMELVEQIGQSCVEQDMLFILEILTYDVEKEEKTVAVLKAMRIFSSEKYGVDLFKVEPIVTTSKFNITRKRVYEASNGKPWVILSGGMDIEKFKDIARWNCQIGASGFLAGRVIWKKAPSYINNLELMDIHLKNTGLYNLKILKASTIDATPFFKTPYFNGIESINLTLA